MKEGQDLENQVAHPQQEHLRSTPLVGADNTLRDLHWEYMCTPTTYPFILFFFFFLDLTGTPKCAESLLASMA